MVASDTRGTWFTYGHSLENFTAENNEKEAENHYIF